MGRLWTGPERCPVAGSQRKTARLPEPWLPQRSQAPVGSRVKWRGVLPPQLMRWMGLRTPVVWSIEKTTSESSPRLLA